MTQDSYTLLISKEQIQDKIKNLGYQITQDYKEEALVLIGVLKGGFIFLADLIREIQIPIEVDFIAVSSYGSSSKTSGVVRLIKDIEIDIRNKHVILVEDIIDTGLTLQHLKQLFSTREPKSIRLCTVFDKPSRRRVEMKAEYTGFEIPDEFVIGYGLDFNEKYRNLPDLCVLHPSVYSK